MYINENKGIVRRDMFRKSLLYVVIGLFTLQANFRVEVVAQSYPSRPIRFIVPYPPGGTTDIIARIVAQRMSESIGKPVVVDNRPGANTIVGSELAARAAADGYTMLLGTSSTLSINPHLYRQLPYDVARDFAPVTQISAHSYFLVAGASLAANTVQELIALARVKPNQLSYASTGNGSTAHFGGALLGLMAGVKMTHVPYKGNAPTIVDLMSGQVHFTFTGLSSVAPFVKNGKLKLIAFAADRRMIAYPDIPTVAEAGFPGFRSGTWFSVVTRSRTARPIIHRLNQEIVTVLKTPDTRERLEALGYELVFGTPEALQDLIQQESKRFFQVQKEIKIQLE